MSQAIDDARALQWTNEELVGFVGLAGPPVLTLAAANRGLQAQYWDEVGLMSIFTLPGLVMKIDHLKDGWTFSACLGGASCWGEKRPTSAACYLEIVGMVSRARGALRVV